MKTEFPLVLEYIYYDLRLNQVISCSNDQQTAVVIGCIKASASSEIQLTENGIAEFRPARVKSADPKAAGRKRQNTMSTGFDSSFRENQFIYLNRLDLNDDGNLPSIVHHRSKRDSTTSYFTQSSSQENSKKHILAENRADTIAQTTTSRSVTHRHNPIIRAAQIRCDADQTIFKIHKGVKTFDLCTAKNVLVTGGMDRVIRIWNPYLPARPVARLRGHNAPVFLVKIAVEDNRLFSISADKTVLVSTLPVVRHKRKRTIEV